MTSEADNPPTPEPAGNVVLIAPVPCGVLSVRSAPSAASAQSAELCDPPMLRSGSTKRDEFVALLSFDLRALPAGSEVLYAGLELVGLDDAFLDEVGRWTVRAVALPEHAAMQDLSFARIMAAPAVEPAVAWRLGRAELAPGGRNTLKMDGEGLGFLAGQLGRGSVAFRIEGPLGDTNLFDWEARGPRAPRLRLAYTLSSATATAMPLVVWDATPTAGATQGRGAAAASPTP